MTQMYSSNVDKYAKESQKLDERNGR